jgi:hypothetical protein
VLQIQPIPLLPSDLLIHTSLNDELRTATIHDLLHYTQNNSPLLYLFHSHAIPLRAAEMLTTVLVIYTEYRNITFSTTFWGFGPTDCYSDSLHGAIRSLQAKDKIVFMLGHVPSVFHPTAQFCFVTLFII